MKPIKLETNGLEVDIQDYVFSLFEKVAKLEQEGQAFQSGQVVHIEKMSLIVLMLQEFSKGVATGITEERKRIAFIVTPDKGQA